MSPTSRWIAVLFLAVVAAPLRAWEDPFDQWQAAGYLQLLQVNRPDGQLPPPGPLNSDGQGSAGYNRDGLYWRKLETKLSGPLGWERWRGTLAVGTDLNSVGFTDAFVDWTSENARWNVKLGQTRLPFGWENQVGSASLITIQRSLMYGFQNYGHVANWGLGLLNERGVGVRADYQPPKDGHWHGLLQAGAFLADGYGFRSGDLGLARLGVQRHGPWFGFELALSLAAGSVHYDRPASTFVPLGYGPSVMANELGADGRSSGLLPNVDLGLDLGWWHTHCEATAQAAHTTSWLDIPSWEARSCRLYGRLEFIGPGDDGVRAANHEYYAQTLGLAVPLPGLVTLKAERLQVLVDGPDQVVPGGDIWQAQMQMDF